MTPDQAQRILSEPKYVVTILEQTIKDLGAQVIEPTSVDGNGAKPLNALQISELRGVVRGIRIAQGIFKQAQQVLAAAEEEKQIPREKEVPHIPPGLAAAHLKPHLKEEVSGGGD